MKLLIAFMLISGLIDSSGNNSVRIGVHHDPPMVFLNDSGNPSGLYIDILEHIASLEEWETEYIRGTWTMCLSRLESGDIDIITAVPSGCDRIEELDFCSEAVIFRWGCLYCPSGAKIDSLQDLRGITLAVMTGDPYSEQLLQLLHGISVEPPVIEMNSYSEVLESVGTGDADAGVATNLFGHEATDEYGLVPAPIIWNPTGLTLAAAKGRNGNILAAIDERLVEMKKDRNSIYYRSLAYWIEDTPVISAYPGWVKHVIEGLAVVLIMLIALSIFLRIGIRKRTVELVAKNRELEQEIIERSRIEHTLQAVISIANSVGDTEDLRDLFQSIKHHLSSELDTTNFYVALYNPDTDTYRLPFVAEEKKLFSHIGPGKTLTSFVTLSKKPLLIDRSGMSEMDRQGLIDLAVCGAQCLLWLGVPLMISDRVIGVLAVQSYSSEQAFDENDMNLLASVSGQLAIAIERQKALDDAVDSQQRMKLLFEADPTAVFLETIDGRIQDCNPRAEELTGYSREELLSMKASDLICADISDTIEEIGRQQSEIGTFCIESMHRRKNAEPFPAEARGRVLTSEDGSRLIFVAVRDDSARKQAEEALIAEKGKLSVTLESINNGVISTDAGCRIMLMNRVAESLTGVSTAEASGQFIWDVMKVSDPLSSDNLFSFRESTEECPEGYPTMERVISFFNRSNMDICCEDGSRKPIESSCSPIIDDNGNYSGLVLAFSDITDRRKMEEEILKSQKLESIGVLAGGIAHDFNNILTAILGKLNLARLTKDKEHDLEKLLRDAEKAVIRARDLTQQLLTFSKGGEPLREVISLKETLVEATNLVLRGSKVTSEFNLPDDLFPVFADRGQIHQVMSNIVINARQAISGSGRISVSAVNCTVKPGMTVPLAPGVYVQFTITDTGSGISQDEISRIFDPYYSTKPDGHGLGLATCFSIVRRHGGYIGVDSSTGSGTAFSVYLPAAEGGSAVGNGNEYNLKKGSGHILVVDDDRLVLGTIQGMLESLGYRVSSVTDGSDAIDLYKQKIGTDESFDLLIMDLTIPGGLGGKDAMRELLRIDPGVIAIVSSGYSNDPVMASYSDYGFAGVLSKPFSMEELSRILSLIGNVN